MDKANSQRIKAENKPSSKQGTSWHKLNYRRQRPKTTLGKSSIYRDVLEQDVGAKVPS